MYEASRAFQRLRGVLLILTILIGWTTASEFLAAAKQSYHTYVPLAIREYMHVVSRLFLNPLLYAGVAIVFILERQFPAKEQPFLSAGLCQDVVWFIHDGVLQLFLLPVYAGLLRIMYEHYFDGLTIHALAAWPEWARAILAVMAFDFLHWLHHVLRHKVPAFWLFHTIHHSQRELNVFTDLRVHSVEPLIANTIIFVPMFMLQLHYPTVLVVAVALTGYTRLVHANLRTNFGILKHVLVTPQSHRIHHSIEQRHQDKNFGVLFTVWDRLFGTLYPGYDEYPETGLRGHAVPLERSRRPLALLKTFAAQTIYPFTLIVRRPSSTLNRSGGEPAARPV